MKQTYRLWCLAFVLLCSLDARSVLSQASSPLGVGSISQDSRRANDPVQVIDFYISGPTPAAPALRVQSGETFQIPNQGWLRNTRLEAKNVSKKTVTSVWLSLTFPGSDDGHSIIGDQIHLGGMPDHAYYNHAGERLKGEMESAVEIKNLESFQVSLGQHFDSVLRAMKQRGLNDFTKVALTFSVVYFADGTRWSPNVFEKADLTRPGKYVRISPSEFYGESVPVST